MAMTAEQITTIRALMEYEAARTAPPEGFPALPDLPGGRYTDPRFFALEQAHIWRKSWLLAAHADEFPEVGSFRLWEMAGQPVLLVRGRDDVIRGFYNTCSHRGAPVVTEESGRRVRLTCKYHGWTYDLDGVLKSIRDEADFRDFDPSCRGLTPVRVARYGNLIFVNFSEDAPSLMDWLGPIADEWDEFQFDKCRLAARHVWDLDCNWKIAMEANTEVYHVPNIHPNTVAQILDHRRNVNTFYPHGHGRMIAPAPKDNPIPDVMQRDQYATISTVGEIGRTCTQSYGMFPNFVAPLSPSFLPPILFWPHGIDKCRVETWTMAPDWGDGPKPSLWTEPAEDGGVRLSTVLREDFEFGVWIQKSVESYGFKGVPLSYQEARIYYWNQACDRMIGIENIPEDLRVAQVITDAWVWPNDPRVALMHNQAAAE